MLRRSLNTTCSKWLDDPKSGVVDEDVHVLLSDRMWDRVMLKEPQGLNTAAASNPRAR